MTKYMVTAKVEHKGYEINYNERLDQWETQVKDRTIYDPKLSEVKKKIDRATTFKPERFPVLHYAQGAAARGEVTSWDGTEARVTLKTEKGVVRDKAYISTLFDDTPANLALTQQIAPLRTKRFEIDSQIRALEKKLTNDTVRENSAKASRLMRGEAA